MVVDYKSRKNEVLASYNTVEELVADLQSYAVQIEFPDPTEKVVKLLESIRKKAQKVKADRFNIMIAGESKSGKSTFINAYLGVELLPMDVKQCTSAIIEIKYGSSFSLKAKYAGGREKSITDEKEARDFLKKNAALDDQYRGIPVPTINSEILVKSGLRAREKGKNISISDADIAAMLASPEVQSANIHNYPDYENRIRDYINKRKDRWEEIVTGIEIAFPFPNEDFRGIHIIDSPGIHARGGVAEITSKYIENADAIIFLKPVTGQSLESTQFSQFMENVSVERNKGALFLVLTHIADKNGKDLRSLEEEAQKQFSGKLDKDHILFVDSKAELYAKHFAGTENIEDELRRLKDEKNLDPFVLAVYSEAYGPIGDGGDFIEKLKEKSRFNKIYQSLEAFGRKAHYMLFVQLLEQIIELYKRLWNDLDFNINLLRQKAEDPNELAKKIAEVKQDLDKIQNQISRGVDRVVQKFRGDEGYISKTAKEEVEDFLEKVGKIAPDSDTAFNDLERLSLQKIDRFVEVQEELQQQMVKEFDEQLVALSDKSSIPFESLQPDFSEETFKEIKEATKSKANETHYYETGRCVKKTHSYSVYVQEKHFGIIKNDILRRLEEIKNNLIANLADFVENIRTQYIRELGKNADAKKTEMDTIMEAKKTAEQIRENIAMLTDKVQKLKDAQSGAEKISGGIKKHVQ